MRELQQLDRLQSCGVITRDWPWRSSSRCIKPIGRSGEIDCPAACFLHRMLF